MSNYIEFNDRIAFHPGYYLKEIVEESGLTQEDFAKRLGTTPKNLSILIRGEQNLSIDVATKLSSMLGTTVKYWLNLQQSYDEMRAEFLLDKELMKEREVFHFIDYQYFKDNFKLPDLGKSIDQQIKVLREFLSVASLCVLEDKDLATSFRSYSEHLSKSNIVNANAMVQIAVNKALRTEAPKYNKKKFADAVEFALNQTEDHEGFLPKLKQRFMEAGVILVVLPHLKNSGIKGATKKVGSKILLMVNDRRHYADIFWFSLFHEIGHILNGDFGVTFEHSKEEVENQADLYAREKLIPEKQYQKFVNETTDFSELEIRQFAAEIQRDAGIVFGRLQNDGKIPYDQIEFGNKMRHKYEVLIDSL